MTTSKAQNQNILVRTLRENWLLVVIFLFLLVLPYFVAAITGSSPFGEPRGDRMLMRGESVRWQAVFIEVYIFAILAMSYNLMFGFTGVLSFGHAMFFGLGGYILGMMLEYTDIDTGLALIIGVVAAIVIAGLLGLFIGVVSLRLKGVYFAIFTLAIAEMFFIFFSRLQLTKAEDGFPVRELPTFFDPAQNRIVFYYMVLALFVFCFLFIRRLVNSPTGAVFKAVRENEDRAQSIGYDTLRYKLFAIIVASMMAAAAGMMQIILNKKVGPELLGIAYTVDPLLMTIIGGIGTFTGPVIGAAGLELLNTTLRDQVVTIGTLTVNIADIWGLLLGTIFIIVVIVFPQGVVGTWQRWRLWFSRRSNATPTQKPPVVEVEAST